MPYFTQRDGRFFVSYTIGPSHIMLGISFGSVPTTPKLIKESLVGTCSHGTLDESQILSAVNEGLAKAAESLGSSVYLNELVYVENDSPDYDLFRYCAYLIAKRLLSDEPFATASPPGTSEHEHGT